jgi:NTP pyrophosphatase (non-canonical NTP hydrolase)
MSQHVSEDSIENEEDEQPPFPESLVGSRETLEKLMREFSEELIRARLKFPPNEFNLAALQEEVGELSQAMIEYQRGNATGDDIRSEAVQTMVMAARVYMEGDSDFDYDEPNIQTRTEYFQEGDIVQYLRANTHKFGLVGVVSGVTDDRLVCEQVLFPGFADVEQEGVVLSKRHAMKIGRTLSDQELEARSMNPGFSDDKNHPENTNMIGAGDSPEVALAREDKKN